ncbi:carbohydrate esterase family 5 protein [Aspergillus ellipticus CBS 707.79]|uniref:Carbohydrate esterase family 5 protein n=1 Tax=Aspergillus ellipticus CBS 707.79 TaxID=1448320 RepID=A0A319ELT0_9EURO|nr:carbohydrate esterase family 5 protein [Aspergillus ellipticus CBS 707.79]
MLLSAATALLFGQFLVNAAAIQQRSDGLVNSTDCSDVHLIIGRGTTESYPGSLATLAELITEENPGTTYESIIYPATSETSTNSSHIGKVAARDQITSYVTKCPDAKTVLLSYSQFCSAVTAIVFYGDPRHAPCQFYNKGRNQFDTFNVTGKYPRLDWQISHLTSNYGHRIADFCNVGDPVCASGDNLTAHLVYPTLWDTTAAAWVQDMLDKA